MAQEVWQHIFTLRLAQTVTAVKRNGYSRNLDIRQLGEVSGEINQILQDIEDGHLNDAEERIGAFIREAVAPRKRKPHRRAKAWFDAECHSPRATTLKLLHQAREAPDQEALHQHMNSRRTYKMLIKEKERLHDEEQKRRIIQTSENNPFQALTIQQPRFPRYIPMQTWENHFSKMLNKHEIAFEPKQDYPIPVLNPFTESETSYIIAGTKNNKARVPDGIYNEHLKTSQPLLLRVWTSMSNKCMSLGTIPDGWRKSKIKIMYKGKGDLRDLDSYMEIALECTPFKVFTRLLTQRLTILTDSQMPDIQFGFRRGRPTLQAVYNMLNDVEEALRLPGGKLFALFVDSFKAFDMLNRAKLVAKLENVIGPDHAITGILRDIQAYNYVQIDDNIVTSRDITQTNRVLQGDPLSPLLFNIAIMDAAQAILQGPTKTKLYIYADGMVLVSKSKQELQEAFNDLHDWSQENDFTVNKKKTVNMVFRKGGQLSETDFICCNGETLKNVSSFRYLGVTLQTSFPLVLQATRESCTQSHA
jgi:hypothetical protein